MQRGAVPVGLALGYTSGRVRSVSMFPILRHASLSQVGSCSEAGLEPFGPFRDVTPLAEGLAIEVFELETHAAIAAKAIAVAG